MVRILEETRSVARQRRAQLSATTQPQCAEKVDVVVTEGPPPQTRVTEHLVPVMGECPPIASQKEFCPHGLRDKNKRGRVRVLRPPSNPQP